MLFLNILNKIKTNDNNTISQLKNIINSKYSIKNEQYEPMIKKPIIPDKKSFPKQSDLPTIWSGFITKGKTSNRVGIDAKVI